MEIALDTETYPLGKVPENDPKTCSNQCPKAVCLSYFDGENVGLVKADRGLLLLDEWLQQEEYTLVGHNISFDLCVMARYAHEEHGLNILDDIFNAYQAGRIRDTYIRQKLIDIATTGLYGRRGLPGYSLAKLAKFHIGFDYDGLKEGDDAWRVRYNELDPYPIETWPEEAKTYAKLDAEVTWKVFQEQKEPKRSARGAQIAGKNGVVNEQFQAWADMALQLQSVWGLQVDASEVDKLKDKYERQLGEAKENLEERGIVRNDTMKEAEKRRVMREAWKESGLPESEWVKTPKGKISASQKARDKLHRNDVDHPAFSEIRKYNRLEKYLSNYIEPLDAAPPYALCPQYNILVESGRSSSSSPNIQNFPKRNWGREIRKCFEPRDGMVYITADWSTIELCCLAQICINWNIESEMAKAFREGRDLHLDFAAMMLGISYEEAVERYENGDEEVAHYRQVAKIANYGFPGGQSPETFVGHAGKQGVELELSFSRKLRDMWFEKWTGMPPYFDRISDHEQPGGNVPIKQHAPFGDQGAWRERNCFRWTQATNTLFQGMAADGAKFTLIELADRCYIDEESELYGSRPAAFIHDEVLVETPRDRYEEAAQELGEVMTQEFKIMTPDIPIEVEVEVGSKWGSDELMSFEEVAA